MAHGADLPSSVPVAAVAQGQPRERSSTMSFPPSTAWVSTSAARDERYLVQNLRPVQRRTHLVRHPRLLSRTELLRDSIKLPLEITYPSCLQEWRGPEEGHQPPECQHQPQKNEDGFHRPCGFPWRRRGKAIDNVTNMSPDDNGMKANRPLRANRCQAGSKYDPVNRRRRPIRTPQPITPIAAVIAMATHHQASTAYPPNGLSRLANPTAPPARFRALWRAPGTLSTTRPVTARPPKPKMPTRSRKSCLPRRT
jgi:hypothetical protein